MVHDNKKIYYCRRNAQNLKVVNWCASVQKYQFIYHVLLPCNNLMTFRISEGHCTLKVIVVAVLDIKPYIASC